MKIKFYMKTTPERRFSNSNFCVSDEELICAKCGEIIPNQVYFYLCSDFRLNKVWHEEHYDNDHIKVKWKIIGDIKDHEDYLCIMIFDKIIFDSLIELPPINLS